MSFTAPASSKPAPIMPISKKARAAPKETDHAKGPMKRVERPPSPKQPPKKKAKQAEAVPEPAEAAPAKLEIPALVPLNVYDRRFDRQHP